MSAPATTLTRRTELPSLRGVRQLAEQALSRTSGADAVPGNSVRILKDADENYPAWLAAIKAARRVILLENYIFAEDEVGREFADALEDRARAGVTVRLVRDWMGSHAVASRSFWRRLHDAGVDLRCYNPPRLESPFGWLSRDHRKMIAVDGEVAFVTGLCISQRWKGDPPRGVPPWRDTGLEIRGPAVADVELAFAQVWDCIGEPLPAADLTDRAQMAVQGDIAVRVVAGAPSTAGLFRMDQLMAAIARKSLWLTDAYFVGVTPYVQALRSAARDGVDVRLLVPNSTDLPLLRPVSRAGYRTLLEAGVRVFEWNGSMIHAKTAVVDGRWSRIGSSNLNLASFLGNYELDVAIDNERVAADMQRMYAADLDNATEIVLSRNRLRRSRSLLEAEPEPLFSEQRRAARRARRAVRANRRGGSTAAAGAIRIANAVGAAVTNHRVLGPTESRVLFASGAGLLVVVAIAFAWPAALAFPAGTLGLWVAVSLWVRALRLHRSAKQSSEAVVATAPRSDSPPALPPS